MQHRLAFTDCETSGLDPRCRDAGKIAVIRRDSLAECLAVTERDCHVPPLPPGPAAAVRPVSGGMGVVRVPGGVWVGLLLDEAGAVCDDLGGIRASEVSAAGDELHRKLLELCLDDGGEA